MSIGDRILSCIIFLLIFAILIVVVISSVATIPGIINLCSQKYGSEEFLNSLNNDALMYLSPFVISSGVLVALLTYQREKKIQKREVDDKRSRFFFEQSKTGLEEVYDLLKDQNNDRITWIRAARDLLYSLNLSQQIKTPEYKEA